MAVTSSDSITFFSDIITTSSDPGTVTFPGEGVGALPSIIARVKEVAGPYGTDVVAADVLDRTAAAFADIGRSDRSREAFNNELADNWRPLEGNSFDEVVIGGGLHAAIYAATAFARTGRKVPVIEREHLGGIMAVSLDPVFRLNSRNRSGDLGLPGTGAALNVIPLGAIQPADLNGAEYQTNADFAYVIRANLSMFADVYRADVNVIGRRTDDARYRVSDTSSNDSFATANRVILATGPGVPATIKGPGAFPASSGLFSFDSFMAGIGGMPLMMRGWENVAVIGDGDSACCVIEAILGQGPCDVGPASLGTIENVAWWGQTCLTKEEFEEARSRYAGLGRFFPRESDLEYYHSLTPFPYRVRAIEEGNDGLRLVYTDKAQRSRLSRWYDIVIVCVGCDNRVDDLLLPSVDGTLDRSEWGRYPLRDELVYDGNGMAIARKVYGAEIYKVGPCAELPVTDEERSEAPVLDRIPDNSAAVFRYARRTQRLAEVFYD